MHHFAYRDGVLHAEDVDLAAIAAEVGTPFYCYSTATLDAPLPGLRRRLRRPPSLVCYAMKANSNQAVLQTLARLGAGMDVVSEGELAARASPPACRRRRSSSPASARPRARWRWRSTQDILCFNVESEPELEALSAIAAAQGRTRAASRSASTRTSTPRPTRKIATGKSENKFGIPISRAREVYAAAAQLPGLRVTGVDMHIGCADHRARSRSTTPSRCSPNSCATLRADGHAIDHVDLGGGLGIPYRDDNEPPPHPERYAAIVKRRTRDLDCTLIFEPGRLIVGNAGVLVTAVIYVKQGEAKTFVIVDAAMNDLVRPTLYDAHHEICAGGASRRRRRRGSSPTWSGRSAKPAIISPTAAICRSRAAAISWPSCRPAPMARCRPAPTIPGLLFPRCWCAAINGPWSARALMPTH